tara:strand:+ start:742 stop:942 length:201 start_codon:yes stop_codon:yes gene_type:complete
MIKRLIQRIMSEKIQGLIRHGLTVIGTYGVTAGFIDEDMVMEVVGAIMTLGSFVWSWISKNKTEEK